MHLVIVGAGPVGNSLVDLALKAGVDAPPTQRYHAMRIAAGAWVLISIAGGLPFALSAICAPTGVEAEALAVFRQPVWALFESAFGAR